MRMVKEWLLGPRYGKFFRREQPLCRCISKRHRVLGLVVLAQFNKRRRLRLQHHPHQRPKIVVRIERLSMVQ